MTQCANHSCLIGKSPDSGVLHAFSQAVPDTLHHLADFCCFFKVQFSFPLPGASSFSPAISLGQVPLFYSLHTLAEGPITDFFTDLSPLLHTPCIYEVVTKCRLNDNTPIKKIWLNSVRTTRYPMQLYTYNGRDWKLFFPTPQLNMYHLKISFFSDTYI